MNLLVSEPLTNFRWSFANDIAETFCEISRSRKSYGICYFAYGFIGRQEEFVCPFNSYIPYKFYGGIVCEGFYLSVELRTAKVEFCSQVVDIEVWVANFCI